MYICETFPFGNTQDVQKLLLKSQNTGMDVVLVYGHWGKNAPDPASTMYSTTNHTLLSSSSWIDDLPLFSMWL